MMSMSLIGVPATSMPSGMVTECPWLPEMKVSEAPPLQSAAPPEDEEPELPVASVSVSVSAAVEELVSGSPVVVDPSEDELSVSPVVVLELSR
jgi:hypothetical protein